VHVFMKGTAISSGRTH